ncbi:MAG: GntR family transcriptional regulator [Verrucomicrobia bacterium]|nr:GntR family transcriptional regulator [Verrucomicrobiota bacterium]
MNARPIIETAQPVYMQIARFLRVQIVEGKLRPSEHLLTTQKLARQWGVGHTTVHRALARLTAEGLLDRKRRGGTFVKSNHSQGVIGVLIGQRLTDEPAYFSRAILRSIRSEILLMKDCQWTCRVYDGLTEQLTQSHFQQNPVCRQFTSDLENYSFKGLIQIVSELDDLEALKPGLTLPVVRLESWKSGGEDVKLDPGHFAQEAVKLVARRGAKKIAYLRIDVGQSNDLPDLQGLSKGIETTNLQQPEIIHIQKQAARNELLGQTAYEETLRLINRWQNRQEWPDALIISDDIVARSVAIALINKGCPVDGRIQVVTATHDGFQHPYGIPLVEYKFSPGTIARTLLQILWKRILGQALPDLPITIHGYFDFSTEGGHVMDRKIETGLEQTLMS